MKNCGLYAKYGIKFNQGDDLCVTKFQEKYQFISRQNYYSRIYCQRFIDHYYIVKAIQVNKFMKSSQLSQLTKSILESHTFQKQYLFTKASSPLLHKPCPKDLRISYLEQYELNGHRSPYDPQLDRSRTKDALKDITEKYGFVWDEYGKLKKKDDSISSFMRNKMMKQSSWRHERSPIISRSPHLNKSPTAMNRSPKMNRSINEERGKKIGQKQRGELNERLQEINQYKYSKELMRKEIQQIEPSPLQESEIDNKINQIWSKYKSYESNEHYSFRPNAFEKQNYQRNYEQFSLSNTEKFSIQISKNKNPLTTASSNQSLTTKAQLYKVLESTSPLTETPNKFSENFIEKTPEAGNRKSFMDRLQIAEKSRTPENRAEIKEKKYDDKINEITNKIMKCQAEKEKMKIDYKKFDVESVSRSKSKSPFSKKVEYCSHSPVKIMKEEVKEKKVTSNMQKQEIIKTKYSQTPVVQKQIIRMPTQKESPTFETTHEYQNLSKSFSFEAGTKKELNKEKEDGNLAQRQFQEYLNKDEERRTRKSQEGQKNSPKGDYQEIQTYQMEKFMKEEKPLETSVEQNRQSVSHSQGDIKNIDEQATVKKEKISTNKKCHLIDTFIKQIQIDEEFRNSRAWFYNNDDPHKWGILADLLLEKHQMKYNYHELVEKFQSLTEQRNPFFSTRDCQENYQSLISSFIASEEHWKRYFVNKFNEESLEVADFTTKELDVENKGKLRVQDFVRYLNMKTNCFYRNRDLVLIFARLAGRNKPDIPFSKVLRILTL